MNCAFYVRMPTRRLQPILEKFMKDEAFLSADSDVQFQLFKETAVDMFFLMHPQERNIILNEFVNFKGKEFRENTPALFKHQFLSHLRNLLLDQPSDFFPDDAFRLKLENEHFLDA